MDRFSRAVMRGPQFVEFYYLDGRGTLKVLMDEYVNFSTHEVLLVYNGSLVKQFVSEWNNNTRIISHLVNCYTNTRVDWERINFTWAMDFSSCEYEYTFGDSNRVAAAAYMRDYNPKPWLP